MSSKQETTLRDRMAVCPFGIEDFIRNAIVLTELVESRHKQNETMGTLSPENLIFRHDDTQAKLIENAKWNAAYCAPEYSGRMNRKVDARSDLYSLGIIFYELLTGRLPLEPGIDSEDWMIAHLVEIPRPLSEERAELAGPIHHLVMKLLAKSPEDRYQTAWGLLADLKLCLNSLEQYGQVQQLDIGRLDGMSKFGDPREGIGHGQAKLQLEAAYEQAVSGNKVFVNIQGQAGVGKTSLVQQFLQSMSRRGVTVITAACTFEQQDQPYRSIVHAVQHGLEQLWSERADEVEAMRSLLHRELGVEISMLELILPEAAALFGLSSQPYPPTQVHANTIAKALTAMIRCFTSSCKPLVMFIDDLQWADSGTIEVLQQLIHKDVIANFMFIGTNLTDESEPQTTEKQLSEINYTEQIDLQPLHYEEVRTLISVMLHEQSTRIRVLSRSVYDRTNGNPASIVQLMNEWRSEKKLFFDPVQQRWTWDVELHHLSTVSEKDSELLDLYIQDYSRVSDETKQLLNIAAIIGTKFDLQVLMQVSGYSRIDLIQMLETAEKQGLVYREEEVRFVDGHSDIGQDYVFMHPQFPAKLLQMYEGSLNEWHYRIGCVVKNLLPDQELKYLLTTVHHLNRCTELLSIDEQKELAQLNFRALRLNYTQRNYVRAKNYAEIGIQLLEQLNEPIAALYPFYLELAYIEYMCGNMEQAQGHFQYLMRHLDQLNREDRIHLILCQAEMFTIENNEEAVRTGILALEELGWSLPDHVTDWTVLMEVLHTQRALRKLGSGILELLHNEDRDYGLLCRLVLTLTVPLLFVNPKLEIVLFARFVRYAMEQGVNKYFYSLIGSYEFFIQRGAPLINRWLPTEVMKQLQTTSVVNEVDQYGLIYIIGVSKQWESPVESARYLDKALRRAMECNDLTMVNLSILSWFTFYNGNVHDLKDQIDFVEGHTRHLIDEKTTYFLDIAKQYCAALLDNRLQPSFIALPETDDKGKEESYACICKLEVAFYNESYENALAWAIRAKSLMHSFDWMQHRKLRWFEAMSCVALYSQATPIEQNIYAQLIRDLLRKMKKWTGYWGAHSSAYYLIRSEWQRIKGATRHAVSGYEHAIQIAKQEQHALVEAMALERLHAYYKESGKASASLLLIDACSAYSEWGLAAKVSFIKRTNSELYWYDANLEEQVNKDEHTDSPSQRESRLHVFMRNVKQDANEEMLSLLMNWSVNVEVSSLISQFLKMASRQAGADRGCILRVEGDGYKIDSSFGRSFADGVEDGADVEYSLYISRYVRKTGRALTLDCAYESYFVKDPYIARQAPASIICMPIYETRDGIGWLLYLENTQVTGVFSKQDLHLLELMITRLTYMLWMRMTPEKEVETRYKNVEPLIEPLSQREIEVLQLLTEGYSNKEIAESLGITEATVKSHVFNIYRKLDVKRRGQAITRAKELEIV